MYMIWLVTAMNGQQRPVAILPAILVLSGVAVTATAPTTRAVATTIALALAVASFPLGHFYICRT